MRGALSTAALVACLAVVEGVYGGESFPSGVQGELYYCARIDLVPGAQGGPLEIELDGEIVDGALAHAADDL